MWVITTDKRQCVIFFGDYTMYEINILDLFLKIYVLLKNVKMVYYIDF